MKKSKERLFFNKYLDLADNYDYSDSKKFVKLTSEQLVELESIIDKLYTMSFYIHRSDFKILKNLDSKNWFFKFCLWLYKIKRPQQVAFIVFISTAWIIFTSAYIGHWPGQSFEKGISSIYWVLSLAGLCFVHFYFWKLVWSTSYIEKIALTKFLVNEVEYIIPTIDIPTFDIDSIASSVSSIESDVSLMQRDLDLMQQSMDCVEAHLRIAQQDDDSCSPQEDYGYSGWVKSVEKKEAESSLVTENTTSAPDSSDSDADFIELQDFFRESDQN